MTSRAQSVTLLVHAVIGLAIIGAATYLAHDSVIDSQAVVAIFGTVIGLVGGSAGTLAVVGFQQPPSNGVRAQIAETDPQPHASPSPQP